MFALISLMMFANIYYLITFNLYFLITFSDHISLGVLGVHRIRAGDDPV